MTLFNQTLLQFIHITYELGGTQTGSSVPSAALPLLYRREQKIPWTVHTNLMDTIFSNFFYFFFFPSPPQWMWKFTYAHLNSIHWLYWVQWQALAIQPRVCTETCSFWSVRKSENMKYEICEASACRHVYSRLKL